MNAPQQQLIDYTKQKVKELFRTHPSPGHAFDHAERVAQTAILIAKAEKANLFLTTLCGLLHDVGRAIEKEFPNASHHELSYRMLQIWFKNDSNFSMLSKKEKLIILYAVRYHWNDVADKYKEAVILRDADKLDALGKIGIQRSLQITGNDVRKMQLDMRLCYQMFYWLRTSKAKQLARQHKSIEHVNEYIKKLLKKGIAGVSL